MNGIAHLSRQSEARKHGLSDIIIAAYLLHKQWQRSEKGKPVVRRGRKVTGLLQDDRIPYFPDLFEIAGLPGRGVERPDE